MHGWVTKMRGTLFDNEHVRRAGIREMKAAKAIREYKRKRAAEKRARGESSSGLLSFFRLGSRGSRRSRSRHGSSRTVLERGTSSRSQKNEPYLHFSHRVKPHHHGHGTRIVGHITQNKDLVAKGVAMNKVATRERDKERQRRQRHREREARGLRRDASKATRR